MKLVAYPLVLDGVFFLQPVDKALADITEGSDIVGKYFKVDHCFVPLKKLPCSLRLCFNSKKCRYISSAGGGVTP